ncbi:MAG: glycosyl transferase, partial [Thermomicrobiales bacterium]
MLTTLHGEGCGIVGAAAAGLPHLDDVRPHQHGIEVWQGPVMPEPFSPGAVPWERQFVNNAANHLHWRTGSSKGTAPSATRSPGWGGRANVLYDRAKLLGVGGFGFWNRLPPEHAGEEAVVQFLLI